MTSESGCATKVGSERLRYCRRPLQGTTTLSLGWTICEPRHAFSHESAGAAVRVQQASAPLASQKEQPLAKLYLSQSDPQAPRSARVSSRAWQHGADVHLSE